MYFSAWANSAHPWTEVRDFATAVENMGWDGFWYADHYMPNTPDGEPIAGNFKNVSVFCLHWQQLRHVCDWVLS